MNIPTNSRNLIAAAFRAALDTCVSAEAKLCVAYSGGMDSTVLLHIAVQHAQHDVRAIYIDHGLQAESTAWAAACEKNCNKLGVPFTALRVHVDTTKGESVEAAARKARYVALGGNLQSGEVLLTAHHEQDQLETFLLQSLRGGLRGLAAMPLFTRTEGLPHLRPLLTVPDALLRAYALEFELDWQEDPSNSEQRFDRNYLRHEVLPKMLERWPGAAASVSRSARLIGESAELLDELARVDLADVASLSQVPLSCLNVLPEIRQKNALRFAIRASGLPVPSEKQLNQALDAMLGAPADGQPLAAWPGGRIRRFRDVLWLFAEHDDPLEAVLHAPATIDWIDLNQPLQLGKVRGILESELQPGMGFREPEAGEPLQIRFRMGGERIRLQTGSGQRTLKKLLQESDVLPWMRGNIPLVYSAESLLAVGDIWINSEFAAGPDEVGRHLVWRDHAPVFHVSALSDVGLSGKL